MKKRTLFLLGFAFILIIIGGVGSIFFYQQLEAERKDSEVNKKFKYDHSDELILNIKNSATINLSTSDDDYVHMNKQGLTFGSEKKESTTWNIDKKEKTTTVTIDNKISKQKFQPGVFTFSDISDDSISLKVPEKYKKITIKGDKVEIAANGLTLNNLDIQSKISNFYSNDVTVQDLTVDTKTGDINIDGGKFENNVKLSTLTGNIHVENTFFNKLDMSTKNGEVFTANTKGDLKIDNQNGNTSINHTKGLASVNNKNGEIYFHSNNITQDVTLETVNGAIQMEVDKDSYNKNKVDFKTNYGLLSIFNKNLSSETTFSNSKGKVLIKATSKNGDISVNELDPDDTKYEDD
ncbi:DUF4097 family beta strand repeat-containing protein [Vagococcus sp.]|uniref:DUF4097 family beta strand repeat-containing protein n=1 Tax=Vagococcus sp. TaxID=1933889 RepID=UPI002FC9231A